MKTVLLLIGCIGIVGCSTNESNKSTSDQQTAASTEFPHAPMEWVWLAGTWQRTTSRGVSFEHWSHSDSGWSGEAYRVREADTVVTERLWIVADSAGIHYVAHPRQNDQPTRFTMTSGDSLSASFENPEHDFPTRIDLRFIAPDSMITTIYGPSDDGTVQSIVFSFERISQP